MYQKSILRTNTIILVLQHIYKQKWIMSEVFLHIRKTYLKTAKVC